MRKSPSMTVQPAKLSICLPVEGRLQNAEVTIDDGAAGEVTNRLRVNEFIRVHTRAGSS